MSAAYLPFSSDGHVVRWASVTGDAFEETGLVWENEGWTVSGTIRRPAEAHGDVQYVIRLSPTWQVRQFILFRDLDEPDLWLATDGTARWGEMNGAHRTELDGCYDVHLSVTPFTATLPIRRLPLLVGDTADIVVAGVDVETLDVQPQQHRYTRLDTHRWRFTHLDTGESHEFDVDEHGLVLATTSFVRSTD